MALNTSTLRPGFLVSLKTSLSGNVSYTKEEIEASHLVEDGAQKARWETVRIITDPAEHEAGIKARGLAGRAVRAVCSQSAFGLLCPETDVEKLEAAIKAARAIAEGYNATAKLSRLTVYVMTGRIAADDVEAMKAINSEISDLMARMQDGIQRLDVKEVREAAAKAKEIGAMLSADAQVRVELAIKVAREAATKIVKAGEAAAQEIDLSAVRKITEMRTAFLDLDGADKPIANPAAIANGVDFAPAKPIGPVTFAERSQPAEID